MFFSLFKLQIFAINSFTYPSTNITFLIPSTLVSRRYSNKLASSNSCKKRRHVEREMQHRIEIATRVDDSLKQ